MGSLLSSYPLSMVDFAWVLEFAILTLSWVILGTQKLHGGKALLRASAEFAVLFVALTAVRWFASCCRVWWHWAICCIPASGASSRKSCSGW